MTRFTPRRRPASGPAFTILEALVAMSVLLILMMIIAQLVGAVPKMTSLSNKGQEADFRARSLFSRMALDFNQMLTQADVDYYFKNGKAANGNDQIAFYSAVAGYYAPKQKQGAVSLVGYRVNTTHSGYRNMERLGKGLSWLEDGSGAAPVVHLPLTIQQTWPSAVSSSGFDEDFEEVSTGVFRFEYFFQLKSGELSAVPWDADLGHDKADGLRDVQAIVVVVASVDPALRQRVTASEFDALAAAMDDFPAANSSVPPRLGELERQWKSVVDASPIPQKGGGAVRIHARSFALNTATP